MCVLQREGLIIRMESVSFELNEVARVDNLCFEMRRGTNVVITGPVLQCGSLPSSNSQLALSGALVPRTRGAGARVPTTRQNREPMRVAVAPLSVQ